MGNLNNKMQQIIIQTASEKECDAIAKLHFEYIPTGFLSSLGIPFLRLLYQSMTNSKYAFCIIALEDNKVIGFVSSTTNVSAFYKEFMRRNFFKAVLILLPKFFNIKTVRKIFETLFYPIKKNTALPKAELLSIVVDKNYQGKGVSKELFKRLVNELGKRGVREFKVVVGENLMPACKFYEKMGGVLYSKIEVHKGEWSRIYVWKL